MHPILRMVEATNSTSSSSKATESLPNSIRRQRGSIDQNFRRLKTKYEYNHAGNLPQSMTSIDTDRDRWSEKLHRLRLNHLPLLRQQINTLPKLLAPSELQHDRNGPKLQLILDVQSELDQNLDHITSLTAGIRERSIFSPARTDDNHLQEFKEFRRQGLVYRIKFLTQEICLIFDRCIGSIQELKIPKGDAPIPAHQTHKLYHRARMIRLITVANKSIDQLIKWLTSHEFITIQENWKSNLVAFDHKITELTEAINRSNNPPAVGDDDEDEDFDFYSDNVPSLNEAVAPLAQSVIAVIKLCRVFFKKLARNALNQIPSQPFTDMNSYQLNTLSELAALISADLGDLVNVVEDAHALDAAETIESLSQPIQKILHRFDSSILLVIVYIIPLLPNHNLSSPSYIQSYLVDWNSLFLNATQNCIRAAQSLNTSSRSSPRINPIDILLSLM